MIRSLVALVAVCIPATARADSFVEIAGGVMLPVANDDWTNAVDVSPKLGIRLGGGRPDIEGILVADWTPAQAKADPLFTDVSYHRFRILAGAQLRHAIAPNIRLSARLGLGIDIAHASYTVDIPILGTTSGSDTHTGFAFEPAIGIWYAFGKTEVGFELAVPIGSHDRDADPQTGQIGFHYTSVDVDLLGVVRFGS
jgi:hypothetical protein